MLQSLKIQNFALIDSLEIDFNHGMTTITGETGAGKSIILGALSLLIGQRADSSILKKQDEKAIIEAIFNITQLNVKWFFEENEIQFEHETIVRREISPNGKSRAFINDSPVTLDILKTFGEEIIDIHSQHQNHFLNSTDFQQNVVDYYASIQQDTDIYNKEYTVLKKLEKELNDISQHSEKLKQELQFKTFLFEELETAKIQPGELLELEEKYEQLTHIEELKESFLYTSELLDGSDTNILNNLKLILTSLNKTKAFYKNSELFVERFNNNLIELKDISREISAITETLDSDPEKLSLISSRLDLLSGLLQKHKVKSTEELLEIKNQLDIFLQENKSFEDEIERLGKNIFEQTNKLNLLANRLHKLRTQAAKPLGVKIKDMLKDLGMPNAEFEITVNYIEELRRNGKSETVFKFSANKNMPMHKISETASGGEISRIMLCLKTELSKAKSLPTIIFDEIDTGVSGDIADKMGNIMKTLAQNIQVICITHLPQIAAKGNEHYVVYKEDTSITTNTNIKKLNKSERIQEIAKMISGKTLTNTAVQHAEELLKGQI